MLSVGTWRVLGERLRVVLVEQIDRGASAAEIDLSVGLIRLLRDTSPGSRAKRLAHELAHGLGFGEDSADVAEAVVGLLIEHGVVVP
jgi:hypothetical protein